MNFVFQLLAQEAEHGPMTAPQQQQQQQPQGVYPAQVRFSQPPRQQIPQGAVGRSMPSPGTPGTAPHQPPFTDQPYPQAASLQGPTNSQVTLYQQQGRMQRTMSVPGQLPGVYFAMNLVRP